MSMFDKKQRQELDRLGRLVEGMMRAVPATAREYQRQCKRLGDDIDAERQKWHVSDEVLLALGDRCQDMGRIAYGLGEVIKQAESLKTAMETMDGLVDKEPLEVADELKAICQHWRSQLAAASNTLGDVALADAKQALRVIERDLHLHVEALRAFQKADALLKTVRPSNESAVAELALRNARAAVRTRGLVQDNIDEIKQRCAPLEAESKREDPPEIKQVSSALTDIRAWDRALGRPNEDIRDLEKRCRVQETDWRMHDDAERQALLNEAISLRTARIRQGQAQREALLSKLRKALDDLTVACGRQPEVESSLGALEHKPFERANYHIDWLENYAKAEKEFKAIADPYELVLRQQLSDRLAACDGKLQELMKAPLPQKLRQEAQALRVRLDDLEANQHGRELLVCLREANECLTVLEGLEKQADKEREKLNTASVALRLANAQFQRHAATAKLAWEDLGLQIEALGKNAHNPDLDEVLGEAEKLKQRLKSQGQVFIADCQKETDQRVEACARLAEALRRAGRPVPAHEPPASPPSAPNEYVQRLIEQEGRQAELRQAVAEGVAELRQRLDKERQELEMLLGDASVKYAHKEAANKLLDSLKSGKQAADEAQRLEDLARQLSDCARFWAGYREEGDKLREHLDTLKRHLLVFEQERLAAYCPKDLLDQADDWLRGIPDPPQEAHRGQLQQTEDLLRKLERHARRRVADKVRGQVERLARIKHRSPKKNIKDEAAALLAEIGALGHEQHLPYEQRKRLDAAIAAAGSDSHD